LGWFINEVRAYQGKKKIVFKTNQYTGFQSNSHADKLELHKTEICNELAKSPNYIPSIMSMDCLKKWVRGVEFTQLLNNSITTKS
jgi:hypothetical protein